MDNWEQPHTHATIPSITIVLTELCRAMTKPSGKADLVIYSCSAAVSG